MMTSFRPAGVRRMSWELPALRWLAARIACMGVLFLSQAA